MATTFIPRKEDRGTLWRNGGPAWSLQAVAIFFFVAGCKKDIPPPESPVATVPGEAKVSREESTDDQPSRGPVIEVEKHIADAQAEIALAEQTVEVALVKQQPTKTQPPTGAPPQPVPLDGEPGGRCATACTALASMKRSTDYLCRLAGEGDSRCADARGKVRGAEARIQKAQCTCDVTPTMSSPP